MCGCNQGSHRSFPRGCGAPAPVSAIGTCGVRYTGSSGYSIWSPGRYRVNFCANSCAPQIPMRCPPTFGGLTNPTMPANCCGNSNYKPAASICPDKGYNQPSCGSGCDDPCATGGYLDPRLKKIVWSQPVDGGQFRQVRYNSGCTDMIPKGYIPASCVPGNGPQLLGCKLSGNSYSESEGMDCPNYLFNYPNFG